ncbi:MAG: DUF4476 domain-containing protein, partial [Ferruginibacter sp.]
MTKYIIIVLFYLMPGFLFAQKTGSITIISDSTIPLIIYLDNVKQNDSAVSQIRIEGLTDKYYRVRGIRGDTSYFDRYLLVVGYDDKLLDATYKVRRIITGRIRVSLYAMLPANNNFWAPSSLYVMKVKAGDDLLAENSPPKPKFDSTWIVEQKAMLEDPDNKNENAVVKKDNKTVKKEVDEPIRTSVKNVPNPQKISNNNSASTIVVSKANIEQPAKTTVKTGVAVKKCNGWPITKKDFDLLKKTILESKSEVIKLKNAKTLITGSCFLVNQLDEITELLKTEDSKLDFVKFAYGYTIDRPN